MKSENKSKSFSLSDSIPGGDVHGRAWNRVGFRRIFLAVRIPQAIISYQEELRKINLHIQGIKWMRPGNIHLTVYFIGNIREENFEKVIQSVQPILSLQKKFSLLYENISLVPHKKPRMIWAKYHKNKSFTLLSNNIHHSLFEIIGENKFYYIEPVPHITLARFHAVIAEKNKISILAKSFPEFAVSCCELWETVKVEGRSDYRCVSSFPFSD